MHSIIEYYAEHESYRCGYCRSSDTNYSHGMWAHTMTVSDYQDLIDRGWRRSGKYCYKPTMDVTCCPMYTIRCRALEFKASKSQKKVLKQFNKYLSGHESTLNKQERRMSTGSGQFEGGPTGDLCVEAQKLPTNLDVSKINKDTTHVGNATTGNEKKSPSTDQTGAKEINNTELSDQGMDAREAGSSQSDKQTNRCDTQRGPCKKAKQLRLERKLEKLKRQGVDINTLEIKKDKEKQLEDFLKELPEDTKHKLEIKLVRTSPPSPEWLASAEAAHHIYAKYQMTVHEDKPDKCTEPKFRDFLVTSPLLEEYTDSGPPCGYGSFHQQYWLDGKLVAFGVIDILPKCVSSVYFVYDPDYRELTFGTYGALREIEFTRKLHASSPDLKYYYMGFYIHSCMKMRYKGNFHPSDLLCPETYKWFPIKDCIPKLDASPYARLDPDIDSIDENDSTERDLDTIPILVNSTIKPFRIYIKKVKHAKREIECLLEYAKLAGRKSIRSLILVR